MLPVLSIFLFSFTLQGIILSFFNHKDIGMHLSELGFFLFLNISLKKWIKLITASELANHWINHQFIN